MNRDSLVLVLFNSCEDQSFRAKNDIYSYPGQYVCQHWNQFDSGTKGYRFTLSMQQATPELRDYRTQARIHDFGQGGQRSFDPRGALSQKFAQNRGFFLNNCLKTAWFWKKILRARGVRAPRPPGSASGTSTSCVVCKTAIHEFLILTHRDMIRVSPLNSRTLCDSGDSNSGKRSPSTLMCAGSRHLRAAGWFFSHRNRYIAHARVMQIPETFSWLVFLSNCMGRFCSVIFMPDLQLRFLLHLMENAQTHPHLFCGWCKTCRTGFQLQFNCTRLQDLNHRTLLHSTKRTALCAQLWRRRLRNSIPHVRHSLVCFLTAFCSSPNTLTRSFIVLHKAEVEVGFTFRFYVISWGKKVKQVFCILSEALHITLIGLTGISKISQWRCFLHGRIAFQTKLFFFFLVLEICLIQHPGWHRQEHACKICSVCVVVMIPAVER